MQRLKDGKCSFPSDPKVMELHKKSKCNIYSIEKLHVYCLARAHNNGQLE